MKQTKNKDAVGVELEWEHDQHPEQAAAEGNLAQ